MPESLPRSPFRNRSGRPTPPGHVRLGPLTVAHGRLIRIGLVLVVCGAVALAWGRLDLEDLHARARDQSGFTVISIIALAPMIGFPVSWLHLIAGVRFEFIGGMLVVLLTGFVHHALGWLLVRVLPSRLFQSLDRWRNRLDGAGHRDACLLCCLLPGIPYSIQLYLLPVMGVPFSLLMGICVPLHTARALVTTLLGDSITDLTPVRITSLVVYYLLLFGVSTWALFRLRRTLTGPALAQIPVDPARVASRAEQLWHQAGRPTGRDVEFWLQAEAALRESPSRPFPGGQPP